MPYPRNVHLAGDIGRCRGCTWILQRGADGIVAVSEGVADDMAVVAGIPRHRITPIYNPVIDAGFDARASQAINHAWLAEGGGGIPLFVFAGRLTEQKDPASLLSAMALLLKRRQARLAFLGEGPLLPALKLHAEAMALGDRVIFAGFQENPLPWIRRAAALVLCSRYEGLGNVIIEALACGTPVISTDCPHGPSEILLGGKLGRLVPVGDAEALAHAMAEQIDNPSHADALVARSLNFTAEACADAHQALFARLFLTRKVLAFGLRLSPQTASQIVARILCEQPEGGTGLIVTPNLDHIRLLDQADFRAAYAQAEITSPDGFPVLLYARLRGLALKKRVTGCDIYQLLANHPDLATRRMFVVVESPATEDALRSWARLRGLETNICVSVAPSGLVHDKSSQHDLAVRIAQAAPQILVMTLGAPVSEVFVHQHRDLLPPCWALCVGQAVRVQLGLTRRAPGRWRRLGLEWLWRLAQEPRRLLGRYVRSAAWFPVAVMRDLRLSG